MPSSKDNLVVKKKVKIAHTYPDTLQSHFVSNVVVQHELDHFVLSFFEIWPPAILGETDEERRGAIQAIETVEAKCVARLVLTPKKMRGLLHTLGESVAKYDELVQAVAGREDE